MPDLLELLKGAVERDSSDVHIAVGKPPLYRIDGVLIETDHPRLVPEETKKMIFGILNDTQKQRFEEDKELDFSLSVPKMGRFRVNAHYQRGSVAAAFRLIPSVIRNFKELHLPDKVLAMLCKKTAGLVLVTGPTGSGKSTSLAAMIDVINNDRECHIITIEDPIEYLFPHNKSLVEQREVGDDTLSFAKALRHVLRQDPDVIMVGEMRDLETIATALTAAETGHLVLSTLHTVDTAQTIDRVIDVFPPHQQEQVRVQLAGVIQSVLCQRLLPSALGRGREVAVEVMLATDAVRNLIREGKTHQIHAMIEAGGKYMMQTMDKALTDLYKKRRISRDQLLFNARKPDEVLREIS